jgi:AcrR family transcriptional regulator
MAAGGDEDDAPLPEPPRRAAARGRRRPAGRARTPLSRDAIVDAALAIIDAEGIDALSMRAVAERLGTGAASLYAHVDNKDVLLELVFDRVAGEMRLPEIEGGDWQAYVKAFMREQRRVLTAHRDIARVAMAKIPTGPNVLDIIDRVLGVMREAGLPDRIIGLAPDILSLYVVADAVEASMYPGGEDDPETIAYFQEVGEYFASLPPSRFPNITAMTGALMSEASGDERFEFGLDLLVRGIASLAAEEQGRARRTKRR